MKQTSSDTMALAPALNERTRRLWAAAEAEAVGHGGIAMVARATGMRLARQFPGVHFIGLIVVSHGWEMVFCDAVRR